MNIFERLFGAPSAPPQTIGEMVGGAAADPSQLMDQLANRERTQQVTNYMLYDSPFAEIVQAPLRGLRTFDDVAMGRMPTHVANEAGEMVPNPQMVSGMADLAGSVTVGAGVMPDPSDLRMGIKAYHGSPHDFDRFSLDKIGTGEGAQAYGHGLYFAENEGVARGYRDALSQAKSTYTMPDGTKISRSDVYGSLSSAAESRALGEAERALDWDAARSALLERGDVDGANAVGALRDYIDPKAFNNEPGRVYEVDIKAEPDQFLDYDKPLSDQSEYVRRSLEANLDKLRENTSIHRPQTPEDSARLAQAGIKGIRYLDAGSRDGSYGTRNIVVFDDSIVEILRKYGVGGLLAGGAGGLAVGSQLSAEDRNRS